jgi:hypothetical protein
MADSVWRMVQNKTGSDRPLPLTGCQVYLVYLVCFVYLVDLVHLVILILPNKRDKPNRPNKPSNALLTPAG